MGAGTDTRMAIVIIAKTGIRHHLWLLAGGPAGCVVDGGFLSDTWEQADSMPIAKRDRRGAETVHSIANGAGTRLSAHQVIMVVLRQ